MKCSKCGGKNIVANGRIERSDYGPDGDWYEYHPQKCQDCGNTWDITYKCSDAAGSDDSFPIRGKE